jgi:tRNA (guanosine-2'-O-)-methyltransferase
VEKIKVVTQRRLDKMKFVVEHRQKGLAVILDELYDPFNISAVFRTCDGLGVVEVHLINPPGGFKPARSVCMKAHKWITVERSSNRAEVFQNLKKRGFKIYGTALGERSRDFREIDVSELLAIVLGNEHAGIGEEAKSLCDELIHIPMYGFSQSFNVSVSAAIFLSYITFKRKRLKVDKYLSEKEKDILLQAWLEREENKKSEDKLNEGMDFYAWAQSSSL